MSALANKIPAEEAFVVTVGVPHQHRDAFCKRVLTVLKQAGYQAGPTSNEAILALADEVHRINQEIESA